MSRRSRTARLWVAALLLAGCGGATATTPATEHDDVPPPAASTSSVEQGGCAVSDHYEDSDWSYEVERGLVVGRFFNSNASGTSGFMRYERDAAGRIVQEVAEDVEWPALPVVLEHVYEIEGGRLRETITTRDADAVLGVEHHLHVYDATGRRIRRERRVGDGPTYVGECIYEGERLVQLRSSRVEGEPVTTRLTYDANGLLTEELTSETGHRVVYTRPQEGEIVATIVDDEDPEAAETPRHYSGDCEVFLIAMCAAPLIPPAP